MTDMRKALERAEHAFEMELRQTSTAALSSPSGYDAGLETTAEERAEQAENCKLDGSGYSDFTAALLRDIDKLLLNSPPPTGDRASIVAMARERADQIEPEAWRSEALATKARTLREFADAIERRDDLPAGGR